MQLEAEAATWKLLSHLYGHNESKYPAGFGGRSTAVDTVSIASANACKLRRVCPFLAWGVQ